MSPIPSRRLALLAVPLLLGLLAFPPPSAQEGGDGHEEEEESVIHRQMETINAGLRQILRGWEDEEGLEPALEKLAEVQRAVLVAKVETPPFLGDVADAARVVETQRDYRMHMNELLRGFLDLEDAILAGDPLAVDAAKEALLEVRDAGHDAYKPRRR